MRYVSISKMGPTVRLAEPTENRRNCRISSSRPYCAGVSVFRSSSPQIPGLEPQVNIHYHRSDRASDPVVCLSEFQVLNPETWLPGASDSNQGKERLHVAMIW